MIVVQLIVHHGDVAAAVPEHGLVSILGLDIIPLDLVLAKVLIELLVAANGYRAQVIIVPLLCQFLNTMRAKQLYVLLSTVRAYVGTNPDEEVRCLLLL